MCGLSVIVPVLDEMEQLPRLIAALDLLGAEQLIIVDGGSTDGSWEWLSKHWPSEQSAATHVLLQSSVGRAQQMNSGAEVAEQSMLLFLHADTRLPTNAKSLICDVATEQSWGRFDVQFDSPRKAMDVIAFFMNLRSRISGVATGDQALFMHRVLFEKVGGYENISLMEDVAMSKKLRKLNAPRCLKDIAVTSARRWELNGIVRTVASMWWYRWLFFLGVSPDKFVNRYRDAR